ncbi:hypothetical protein PORCRE_1002 [Porphyromonas crevioricanis JCM 15906]|uniref:Uncharacterized protein n=2 Tax=Porphyromonas crevioricanis TaxID=393921 RepID=A0A2X4PLF9_9PORP|nr:hypothetical protein PORCRE_1002 [Porphyromonas crevioricanis JCM 15906]GAD06621.1 hypothetical protein PORCAN_219 [Porphyromonas crevioricanis JCM 13913]SJZ52274.1 hypothetical protein SAMN02745203_00009 [Porphyromonas crevioricanis]SQH73205.1 Uncharacterised protein [Porphyromonas crevioricanis]
MSEGKGETERSYSDTYPPQSSNPLSRYRDSFATFGRAKSIVLHIDTKE